MSRTAKALSEVAGLVRGPHRVFPLVWKIASDGVRLRFQPTHLYAYANTRWPTSDALGSVVRWITDAQRADGGIPAYYSLLDGYSDSYPEVTGYIVSTLYDFYRLSGESRSLQAAERATAWLRTLQLSSGAFPGGLHGGDTGPSVFNTGQILHGLVRAYIETRNQDILKQAELAADWLVSVQDEAGAWSGHGAYQENAHTYYTMVSWALAQLSSASGRPEYGIAAQKNLQWALAHVRPSGWFDGINLRGHPAYLHFIAYVVQGVLETGVLRQLHDAVQAAERSAWALLRRFETHKRLLGAYQPDFDGGSRFTCLTGNAQISCVWLRLFEVTRDLRYLNAGLKMNEMLKQLLPRRGRRGVVGGVAGSYPIWRDYQPLRYISWGCKFLADALILEERLIHSLETAECAS